MKIAHLVHSLEEARRNNFGREVSNQQGQNLGKQLAAGDPNAQADLAAAKSAQATNKTDATGDTLGQTTPAQRLAAKRAANPTTAPADATPTPTNANTAQATDPQAQTTAPADASGPTGDPTLDKPLQGQPKQGRGFVKGLANVVGQTAKGIGAVAGGVAGVGRAIKKGYNAGADAVGGPGYSSQAGNAAPTSSGGGASFAGGGATGGGSGGGRRSGGGANLQAINQRLTNVERAVGIAESKTKPVTEFYSKFLGQMI